MLVTKQTLTVLISEELRNSSETQKQHFALHREIKQKLKIKLPRLRLLLPRMYSFIKRTFTTKLSSFF